MDYNVVFEELSKEAKTTTEGCMPRAKSLGKAMHESGIPQDKISLLCIKPKSLSKNLIPKNNPSTNWREHYVIEYDGKIFDPSVGRPLAEETYFNDAFLNMKKDDLSVYKSNIYSRQA